MDDKELAREARKQRRLETLGMNEPRCGTCDERDDRVLEAHHVAGRKNDPATVIVCRNCHRKVTDDQEDHPSFDKAADPMLQAIGHFLLGLASSVRDSMMMDAVETHLPKAHAMLEAGVALEAAAAKYPAAITMVRRTFFNTAIAEQAKTRVEV